MYRRILPLLLTAVLALSGYTAGRMGMPQKTERTRQSTGMSGEEGMYMGTTENVIYLADDCF